MTLLVCGEQKENCSLSHQAFLKAPPHDEDATEQSLTEQCVHLITRGQCCADETAKRLR